MASLQLPFLSYTSALDGMTEQSV